MGSDLRLSLEPNMTDSGVDGRYPWDLHPE